MVVRMSMAGAAAAAAASSVLPCTARVLSTSPSTASSSSLPPSLKFSHRTRKVVIRSSNADGPLRRPLAPAAPPLQPPPSTTSVPPKPATAPAPVAAPAPAEAGRGGVVTLEFQRKMAKEMQEYYRVKKIEEADQGPFFGFLGKNEIANGRWAMFGFAVGMLTEYATGSSFVDQLKILLSNFGIVDLE